MISFDDYCTTCCLSIDLPAVVVVGVVVAGYVVVAGAAVVCGGSLDTNLLTETCR